MSENRQPSKEEFEILKTLPMEGDSLPAISLSDLPVTTFKDDNNAFNFDKFSKVFAKIIMNRKNPTPYVIAIDGAWGTGKTSLMNMTKDLIDDLSEQIQDRKDYLERYRQCRTVNFNAWKYSGEEPILAALLKTMFRTLEKGAKFLENEKVQVNFKELIKGVYSGIAGHFTGGMSKWLNELRIEDKLTFYDDFSEILRLLIRTYASDPENERDIQRALVIFIDDLDRCPPDRVTKVLESIKLFLDFPGCIFVLGMDMKMVQKCIEKSYKEIDGFNSEEYLEKMIQLRFRIPKLDEAQMNQYIERLSEHLKLDHDIKAIFAFGIRCNPRAVKRALNDFDFLCHLSHEMEKEVSKEGLAKWTVLENAFPEFIIDVRKNINLIINLEKMSSIIKKITSENPEKYSSDKSGSFFVRLEELIENADKEIQRYYESNKESVDKWVEKDIFKVFLIGQPQFSSKQEVDNYLFFSKLILPDKDGEVLETTTEKRDLRSELFQMINDEKELVEQDFSNANLIDIDLKGLRMDRSDFSNSVLDNSNLSESSIRESDFSYSSIQNSNISFSMLHKSVFTNAKLTNSSLIKTLLYECDIRNAVLESSVLVDATLEKAKLVSANLNNADLNRANLRNADLRKAKLKNANLSQACLAGANFEDADLSGANLEGADLCDYEEGDFINLKGAILYNTRFNRNAIQQEGVDKEGVHLSVAIFDDGLYEYVNNDFVKTKKYEEMMEDFSNDAFQNKEFNAEDMPF